jgi:hypothetical protein
MLHSMDAMEYAHWLAFEKSHGPLNGEWNAEALASIQEQLQQISYLLGQAHFTSKQSPKGPIEKPSKYPRPYDYHKSQSREVSSPDDEQEWLPLTEDEIVGMSLTFGNENQEE